MDLNIDYPSKISEILKPKPGDIKVIDMFAGCGGLALGFEANGFETIGYEINQDAVNTYNTNLLGECHQVELDTETVYPDANVIIGGPPCQPFSVRGKQKGLKDSRDGFPAFISAVERVKPKIFLFENVRGMFFRNNWYLEEIVGKLRVLGYNVEYKLLNAKDYGVAQNRERVIVVGHKGGFSFPTPLKEIVTAGEALGNLAFQVPPESKFLTKSMDEYIARYEAASKCVRPRDLHLHKPARTLTCRNLAGATSDMQRIRLQDGRRRRLLHREAARLQSFPDWFKFSGGEQSVFNQIGNAVPPMLSYYLAVEIKRYLLDPCIECAEAEPHYNQLKLI